MGTHHGAWRRLYGICTIRGHVSMHRIIIKEKRLASVPATTMLNWRPVMFRSVVRPATFALAATTRVPVTRGVLGIE